MNGLAIDDGPVNPFRIRHFDDIIDQDESQEDRLMKELQLRYRNYTDRDRTHIIQILLGGAPAEDIPCMLSKEIKLYICSAGTDSEVERDVFMEHVYPDLRDYCRGTHGLDFHAVDMRWGIDITKNEWPSTETCLNELYHCQSHSMGPAVVAFLGQKYKRYTPPETIEESEFELLKESMIEDDATELLNVFYEKDTNVNPSVFRLQRPSGNKDPSSKMWKDTQKTVQEILEDAAKICLQNNKITKENYLKYTSSEIHMEIQQGILNIPEEERRTKCLLISRVISNMDDLLSSTKRNKFLDFLPCSMEQDLGSETEVKSLRKEMLGSLDSDNYLENLVEFSTNGIHYKNIEEYKDKISRHLYSSVVQLIDVNVKNQTSLQHDHLYREVVQHWQIASDYSQSFIGREDILGKVKEYLLSETDQPLVIAGGSGSGKTAITAKMVSDINVAIRNDDLSMQTAMVFRFVNQTQTSVTAQGLLYSLCHQLAFTMGKYRHDVPRDFRSLKHYFIELVQRGEFAGMLIILLDSLELLSTFENGHKLEWFPSRIAVNVKIIATVNSENPDCFKRLNHKCPENLVHIKPLTKIDCENMMKAMMINQRRSVSYDQWTFIQTAFRDNASALFVRLVFEEVNTWRSYDETDNHQPIGRNVSDIINNIFDRIETTFGKKVVRRVLGYLTASRNGLSESELSDILSTDEEVLNSIYSDWHPKLRRFPPYLVAGIRQALSPYMIDKEYDNIRVLCWKYSSFKEAASDRYVFDSTGKAVHSNIADYYLGKWGGIAKKPLFSSKLDTIEAVLSSDEGICRFLPLQPYFYGVESQELYNERKMTQLPFSLISSGRHDDARSEIFCNFQYIWYRLNATSLQYLLSDYDMFNDRETMLVADALRMSAPALQTDINTLCVELTGRLLPHCRRFKYIRELIHQCDLAIQAHCPLVPNCQIYSSPGGPLQYECDVGGDVYCPVDIDVFNSPDGILLTAKPHFSSRVRVWELSRGDNRPDMMMPLGEIHPTRDGKILCIFQNNQMIKMYRSDCGELDGEVSYGKGRVSDIEVSSKYIMFCVEKSTGPYIIDIKQKQILHRFSFHSHAVAISPDEEFIAFNAEKSILLYQLPLMERKVVGQASDVPQDIIFVNNKPKCFVFTKSKTVESIDFDIVSRKYYCKFIFNDLELKECIISNTYRYLLCRSSRCLHLIHTQDNKLLRKFDQLPEDVIIEPSSIFTGASFTSEDRYIVATRYTFLAVWDTVTGDPLRVLQSSVSPILRVYTSSAINKVVTLLADNSFQVWNLDNIDSNILHSNNIFQGNVSGVELSTISGKVVAFESRVPEAKVLNLRNGQVTDILQHSDNAEDKIRQVILSPNGRFAVTRGQKAEDRMRKSTTWKLLHDDVIWDLEASRRTHYSGSNRFVNFTKDGEQVIFISSSNYSKYDWSDNTYKLVIVEAETGQNRTIPFPACTEFVCSPCIVRCENTEFLSAIVQTCKKTYDQQTNKERSRHYDVQLLMEDLSDDQQETIFLKIQNVLEDAGEDCQFLDVKTDLQDNLMLMYANGLDQYMFDTEKGLVRPSYIEKGLVIYNFKTSTLVRHIPTFMFPSSDINNLTISNNKMVVMDQNRNVFSIVNPRSATPIEKQFDISTARFVLDGRFIVGLTPNLREVIVIRTCDGIVKGRIFVHGLARYIEVGSDDRTVVVGCEDGRVMILTVILELCDPVREIIESFPSRQLKSEKEPDPARLIKKDIRHMMCRTPDHARLSARMQTSAFEETWRLPSHKIISTAVAVTQNNRSRSEMCCVQ